MTDFKKAHDRRRAIDAFYSGQYSTAVTLARPLIKLNKEDVALQRINALAHMHLGEYDEAIRLMKKLLTRYPKSAEILVELGNIFLRSGHFEDAHHNFDKALEIVPTMQLAIIGKANTYDHQGNYDGVERILKQYIDAGTEVPSMAMTYSRLLYHRKDFQGAAAVAAKHLANPDLSPEGRHFLCEHAAKAYEKLEQYDKAFEAFSTANSIRAVPFDPNQYIKKFDQLIATFTKSNLENLPRSRMLSDLPVFIASMPRSGSTLVEQIIHAHPKAFGAGEISHITEMVLDMPTLLGSMQPFPACIGDLTQERADALAKSYLDDLRRFDLRAKRITNKSIENYPNLGLINQLFPGAKVVHVRRHPLDNCFSCYMAQISTDAYPWVSDLRHVAVAYKQFERIMAHWREVLAIPILTVQYEDLVDDTETWIRKIIDFIGLPWDDKCLRYYEADRSVMTLSYDQVRKPIYKSAVKRYEKYDAFIGPLKEELARGSAE